MHHHEDSELVSQGECFECGSSDANALYSDGHTFCFSCHNHEKGEGHMVPNETPEKSTNKRPLIPHSELELAALTKRRISEETCKFFGYHITNDGKQCASYRSVDGKLVAQKLRTKDKDFYVAGDPKAIGLFGQHKWSSGLKLVITEGEIDAMSVAEVQKCKWPVVSVPLGAQSAKKHLAKQMEWLKNFKEIILMFDNDEAGQNAVIECAQLFPPSKVKIAELPLKDASEMLQAGRGKEVVDAIFNAQSYRPPLIVSLNEVSLDSKAEYGLSYPWETLTHILRGISPKQVIGIGAGSGCGKTEFFHEVENHLLTHHKRNIGVIHMEEEGADTLLIQISKRLSKNYRDPESDVDIKERDECFKVIQEENRLKLCGDFGISSGGYEAYRDAIRYMVTVDGCKEIFLDHVTAFTDGNINSEDNKLIKFIMSDLAAMTRELGFTLFFISHLRKKMGGKPHEEGGRVHLDDFLGSSAIKQWASVMIGIERDQQAEDPVEAGKTVMRILKCRHRGKAVGQTVDLWLDEKTTRLTEHHDFIDEVNEVGNAEF